MSDDMMPVGLNDPMAFQCTSENICFNDCCRDLNQALTPYDILRLKQALGISSQVFLREYTSLHYGPESGLPIVEFKPNPATGHACPFVREAGCSVYRDRPGSCRMYPLARAVARNRETGEIQEYFALIREGHCKGFASGGGQTVRQWLEGQDVIDHNRENDKLVELISLKNRIMPGKLEGVHSDNFYMALYDLDAFREEIKRHNLLEGVKIDPVLLEKILGDDLALLNFGIAWVKYELFGQELQVGH